MRIARRSAALELIPKPGHQVILDGPDGQIYYYPAFLRDDYARRLFHYLRNNVEWQQRSISMYGRTVRFPRLIAWFNTEQNAYAFSGLSVASQTIPGPIQRLLGAFKRSLNLEFNSVLLNYYRNGQDSISWHTDAEPELGENPTVASISLGSTRRFMLKHVKTNRRLSLNLEHGSLLVMRAEMMHRWRHQIPKQPDIADARINLTFRYLRKNSDAR